MTDYQIAPGELTRDPVPLKWPMTQMTLGTALFSLGLRGAGTARLEEAVAALEACLSITETIWSGERIKGVRTGQDKARAEIKRRSAQ